MSDSTNSGLRSWVTRRRVLSGAAAGAAGMLGRSAFGQSTPVPATTTAMATPVDEGARPGYQPIEVVVTTALPSITDEQLWRAASIVNAQVTGDFASIWGVNAWVTAARQGEPISSSAWQITVYDSACIDPTHGKRETGHLWKDPTTKLVRPYGFVALFDHDFLAFDVSHECLEMLVNPYMDCFHLRPTIDPNANPNAIPDVLFTQEICDPCSTHENGYKIDGVLVSDFVTPRYFDRQFSEGVNYSFRGNVVKPFGVRPGCYQNWLARDLSTWYRGIGTCDGITVCQQDKCPKGTCPNSPATEVPSTTSTCIRLP